MEILVAGPGAEFRLETGVGLADPTPPSRMMVFLPGSGDWGDIWRGSVDAIVARLRPVEDDLSRRFLQEE